MTCNQLRIVFKFCYKVPWIRYGLSVLLTTNATVSLNTVAMVVNRTVVIGTELITLVPIGTKVRLCLI